MTLRFEMNNDSVRLEASTGGSLFVLVEQDGVIAESVIRKADLPALYDAIGYLIATGDLEIHSHDLR